MRDTGGEEKTGKVFLATSEEQTAESMRNAVPRSCGKNHKGYHAETTRKLILVPMPLHAILQIDKERSHIGTHSPIVPES